MAALASKGDFGVSGEANFVLKTLTANHKSAFSSAILDKSSSLLKESRTSKQYASFDDVKLPKASIKSSASSTSENDK